MSVPITPFLRNALHLDAFVSGATGLLLILGAPFVAALTNLPEALLFWAGIIIVPFVVLLVATARKPEASRLILIDIIGLNAFWVAASFGILIGGMVGPNMLGYAFVIAQALAVGLFAALQFSGFRRAREAIA